MECLQTIAPEAFTKRQLSVPFNVKFTVDANKCETPDDENP